MQERAQLMTKSCPASANLPICQKRQDCLKEVLPQGPGSPQGGGGTSGAGAQGAKGKGRKERHTSGGGAVAPKGRGRGNPAMATVNCLA